VGRGLAAELGPAGKERYERAAENQAQAARTIRDLLAFLTKEQARPLTQTTD